MRQTSQELIENEKKYRDLYENAPIAYFSLDPDRNITKCNHNASRLSGYGKEELTGMNIMDLYVNDDRKTMTPDQARSTLDQGGSVRDVEMKFRHKNQEDTWVSISLDAVRNQFDEILETGVMAIDISKRKKFEKQLLQAQKMEAIGTLAGGIAHDFNNILAPILGYTEMLLMDIDDKEPKRREHLQIIYDCTLYAKGLANQMLTFSKQKDNEFKLLQPNVFVQDALALTRSFLPATIEIREKINEECSLSVVHGIVQSHKGYINVKSKEGEGTCFEVYLPVYIGDIRMEDKVQKDPPIQKGSESILLIDDDKKVAFMVQHMLEKLGYQVACHLEALEALDVFRETPHKFDLVITDLTMPELTGYQLSEKILDIRPDIPVILCTGYGEHINKKKYDLKGIKGFLNKPVAVKDLSNLIRDILDKD